MPDDVIEQKSDEKTKDGEEKPSESKPADNGDKKECETDLEEVITEVVSQSTEPLAMELEALTAALNQLITLLITSNQEPAPNLTPPSELSAAEENLELPEMLKDQNPVETGAEPVKGKNWI